MDTTDVDLQPSRTLIGTSSRVYVASVIGEVQPVEIYRDQLRLAIGRFLDGLPPNASVTALRQLAIASVERQA